MIYVFLGKDISILNKKIDNLVKELNINNIIKYNADEIGFIDILDEVNYVDLFNEKKIIIVSYFSFKKLKENEEKLLIDYLDSNNDNVIILKCIDEAIDERKKVIKSLKEKGNIVKCEKLDYKGTHSYLEDYFKDNKIKIDYNTISRIMFLCDNNLDLCMSEIEKLLLYISDNTITINDVNDVVSKSYEKEIFVFNEKILNKDISGALESYHILVSANVDESIIIDSIAKQYRLLYQVKNMLKDNNYKDIAHLLGINEYTVEKIVPFTSRYSEEEIIDKLYKTCLLDEKIKINGLDKIEVLEAFIVSI